MWDIYTYFKAPSNSLRFQKDNMHFANYSPKTLIDWEVKYLEDHLTMTAHNLNMIRGSQTMRHFHSIINRANLSVREVNLLRSFLTKVNHKINE